MVLGLYAAGPMMISDGKKGLASPPPVMISRTMVLLMWEYSGCAMKNTVSILCAYPLAVMCGKVLEKIDLYGRVLNEHLAEPIEALIQCE
jgi:hypothetical protein